MHQRRGRGLQEDAGDEWGSPDSCSVALDNATTDAYTCVTIAAPDRKGLVYDLMRTVKDIRLRVAFARVGRASPRWRALACIFPSPCEPTTGSASRCGGRFCGEAPGGSCHQGRGSKVAAPAPGCGCPPSEAPPRLKGTCSEPGAACGSAAAAA